jgi:hypothetical protein
LSDFLEMGTRGRRILEGASSNRRGTRTRWPYIDLNINHQDTLYLPD